MNCHEHKNLRRALLTPLLSTCMLTALAPVALSLSAVEARAQQSATGTVTGRVLNAENGMYLPRARVYVDGTTIETLTDDYGNYELRGVPAGPATIKADFTGQTTASATVTVPANGSVMQQINLGQRASVSEDGALILDEFQVNATRMENAREIAINEERLSVSIKNVVATDQFGNIPNGNIGEFVKFMPGVQIDYGPSGGNNQGYSQTAANGISIRGFGVEDTTILIDGLPVSSTVPGSLTNQTGLDQLSLNNASRVELIKVATPDMPANSIGGQVNLITKSAFEYARPTYSGSLFFNWNSMDPEIKKTPGPLTKDTYKITPGTQFTVNYPFSKNFGMSLTGYWARTFNHDYRASPRWNNNMNTNVLNGSITSITGVRSSATNPIMDRYQVTETTSMEEKSSGNIRLDWRPFPNHTLRANVQYSTFENPEAQRRLSFQPSAAAGVDWSATRTVGAQANSSTEMTLTTRDRIGESLTTSLSYNGNLFGFIIGARGQISTSESDFEDANKGHFSGLTINANTGRMELNYNDGGIVHNVQTFTRGTNPQPLDYTQLENWASTSTAAQSGESHNEKTISVYALDVERPLDFLPFLRSNTMSVKAGVRRDIDENKKSGRGTGYREILRPGKSFTLNDVVDDTYTGISPGFGLPGQEWASTYKLFDFEQANDVFWEPDFDEITNTRVENYNSWVAQQKDIKITRDGYYAMLTGSFLKNRLAFAAGARQENEKRVGRTAFTDSKWAFIRNKDGSLYTDAANPNGVRMDQANSNLFANTSAGTALRSALTTAGISFPTTPYGPTTGNVVRDFNARKLQYQANRQVNQSQDGDPSYSINLAYKVTSNIDFKVAYSRSFSLPDLEAGATGGLLPSANDFTIEEFTLSEQSSNNGALGRIRIANPGLKPETSDNWDFELSYYTDNGGKLSAAYYTKSVTNQVQNFSTYGGTPAFFIIMESIGLGAEGYEDWIVQTASNTKSPQKTSGYEFQIQQDLRFLGEWGRRFSGFLTWSMTDFPPPAAVEPYEITHPNGTKVNILPSIQRVTLRSDKFGSAGLMYSGRRFTAQVRAYYKNENQDNDFATLVRPDGNEIRRMRPAETRVDLNFGYMLTKNYSLFASARDVFNGERDLEWWDTAGQIPEYAKIADRKKFGTVWTFGVNGTW